ncbi:MAG TPA: hypothetical protein VMA13_07150 [Candidatus Saccharimonadales bacterium]|nr:hypothetical protein [Candidatus Saccharimonadales bacterium]
MPTEKFTVFYAWQSDSPSRDNRNFIEGALEVALRTIQKAGSIQASPRLDKDTKGITGIPDIANTILEKIHACDAFVADVSFVAKAEGKDTKLIPNPNVMIELGYALSELGWERIIIVLNGATGTIDDLPFDLKNRRWPFVYEVKQDTNEAARIEAKKGLTKQLQEAIEAIAKLPPRQKRGTAAQRLDALETIVPTLSGSITQLTTMVNLLNSSQRTAPTSFTQSIDSKTGCQNRLNDLIQKISTGKFHNVRFQQGMFVVVIMPTTVQSPLQIFGGENEAMLNLALQPLGASGWSHRISGDYLVTTADHKTEGGKETYGSVTEIRTDGCISAVSYEVLNISAQFWAFAGQKAPADTVSIPSVAFEKKIIEGIFSYLKSLKALDTKGPWYLALALINVKKSILHVSPRFMFGGRVFEGDEIRPPIVEIPADIDLAEKRFQPIARALRPVFDFIWREHNHPRSLNYAETGDWVGQ